MRLELDDNNNMITADIAGELDIPKESISNNNAKVNGYNSVNDEIKEQRAKFSELNFNQKVEYIWDYYKWFFIIGIAVIIFGSVFIRDYMDNLKPTYIEVEILNSYFVVDATNTVKSDFIDQFGINEDEYKVYIDTGITLSEEAFDTVMLANQQKIISMYSAQELDVVIGPVDVMEGSANCDCYADLSQVLPSELIDELIDREYEFYYFNPSEDSIDNNGENGTPYFAGVYLDNCSYLNNNGEYGAYELTTEEKKRPIFTIAANSTRQDKAIEFLRFLIENR